MQVTTNLQKKKTGREKCRSISVHAELRWIVARDLKELELENDSKKRKMRREVEASVETVACIQALLSSCKL